MNIKRLVYDVICAALDNAQDMSWELFQSCEWENKKAYEYVFQYMSSIIADEDEYMAHFEGVEYLLHVLISPEGYALEIKTDMEDLPPHRDFVMACHELMTWLSFQNIDWDTADIVLTQADEWLVQERYVIPSLA